MKCINLDLKKEKAYVFIKPPKGLKKNVDIESDEGKKWVNAHTRTTVLALIMKTDEPLGEVKVRIGMTFETIMEQLKK